jgi:hypothetical protein
VNQEHESVIVFGYIVDVERHELASTERAGKSQQQQCAVSNVSVPIAEGASIAVTTTRQGLREISTSAGGIGAERD